MNLNSKTRAHLSPLLVPLILCLSCAPSTAQFGGGGVPGNIDAGGLGAGGLGAGGLGAGGLGAGGLSPLLQNAPRLSGNLQLNSAYDTNISLQEEGGDRETFILSLGGNLSYRLGGGEKNWGGAITYSPNYRFFFSDQNLPGAFQQSGGLSLYYSGGSLSASLQASLVSGGAQNVLAGGFVNSLNYGYSGSLSWRFSPKTSIGVTLGQQINEIVDQQENTTTFFSFNASWQATPLVSLGPFVSFNQNELGLGGSVDSTTYGLSFGYTLTGKTSLSASLGLQDQEFEQGSGDTAFFGSVSLAWRPNDVYSVALELNTNTVALPRIANQIVNNYSLNASVSRSLGVGSLSLGVGYSLGLVENIGEMAPVGSNQEDRRFINARLGYSRPIFGENVNLNASIGYRQGFAGQDFSGFISSLGLSYAF